VAQSILSNTIIATAGRVVNVALGLVVVKLLTSYLGPSGYGAYALLLSFGTILQLCADFGLYLQLTRSIGAEPARQAEVAGTIISLRLLLLGIVFTFGFAIAAFVPSLRPLMWPLLIIGLGLAFQSISQLYMGIFQYHQVVWRATLGDLLGRLGQIGAVMWFGLTGVTLSGMAAAFAMGSGIAWLIHQATVPLQRVRLRLQWVSWKKVLQASWPLGAMLLLNAVYFRIDTVILSFYRPAAEVGWYGLAYRVIESALFFPAMFGGLLLPRMSEAWAKKQPAKLRQYLSEGLTLQVVVVGFVMVTLLLKARDVILLIADETFLPSEPSLMILSFALLCMFFGNVFGFAMIALQKQTTLLRLYLALALANILGNLVAIPVWGGPAAAVTTVLTEATATLVSAWVIWRAIPYRVSSRSLFGTGVAMTLAALVYSLAPASWPFVLQATAAGLCYVAGVHLAGGVTAGQLALLTGVTPKT
jgi:O-antigen/teichoic acid export membrane protein